MAFTILLIVVMTAVAGMTVREIVLSAWKRDEYPRRRLTLRITMALMLIFLLASVLVGVRVFHLDQPQGIIGLWMAFWGCIMLLTGAIVCLAIADLRSIGDDSHAETNRIWRDIAETIAAHEKKRAREGPPPDNERTDHTDADRPTPGNP